MTRGAHCAFVSGFHQFSFAGEIGKTFPSSIFFQNLSDGFGIKSKKSKKSDFWPAARHRDAAAEGAAGGGPL